MSFPFWAVCSPDELGVSCGGPCVANLPIRRLGNIALRLVFRIGKPAPCVSRQIGKFRVPNRPLKCPPCRKESSTVSPRPSPRRARIGNRGSNPWQLQLCALDIKAPKSVPADACGQNKCIRRHQTQLSRLSPIIHVRGVPMSGRMLVSGFAIPSAIAFARFRV